MDPIDLRMASVREARNAERRFCFEVITPHFKRVYQATSEEDMSSWITAINNALQSAVEGRGIKDRPTPSPSPGVGSTFKTILTGKSPSLSHGHGHPHGHGHSHGSSTSGVPVRRTTVGSRPTPGRTSSNSFEENPDKLLQMLRDNDQGNCWCADCGSGSKVEWVSINLAIILCIECSGIHRSLGTHISKVRSLTLDITSFTPDIVELLLLVGNRVSNMVWEARMDPSQKPSPTATREQRLRFITAKYVDHAFVEPLPPSPSSVQRQQTPEDVLIAAVKRNEVQQVLYALALRANPNATDRSRDTHAVYLALAAADPAPPSSSGSSTSGGATSSSNSSTTTIAPAVDPATSAARTVPFPVAEMLLQNGAEIPATGPPFPLGRAAQLYLEAKRGRAANVHTGGAVPVGGPATITVVASETSGGGNQLNGLTNVKDTSSAAAIQQQQQREMEQAKASRLQKRISAGGRLAKTPILEK